MSMISAGSFAFYRLYRGPYAGWRIRDVWRHDPEALVVASLSPDTSTRDAAMIGLFLTLFGGLTYRPVGTPALASADESHRALED